MNPPPALDAADPARHSLTWLLVIVTACAHGLFVFRPDFYAVLGLKHYGVWFLDSFAVLASNEALARGLDPYAANPLDYFGRPHVYSHWWLWLGSLGLTRAHNFWLGLSWVAGFMAVAFCWLRPRRTGELVVFALALGSPPVLFAVNRANNDLVVFVLLTAVIPCLLAGNRSGRWLAVLPIALGAGLKYYPAAAAVLLLYGRDRREVLGRMGLVFAAMLLVGFSLRHDLAGLGAVLPKPEGAYAFGAPLLLPLLGLQGWSGWLVIATVGLAAVAVARLVPELDRWAPPAGLQREYLGFILGAAVLSTCFWLQANFPYRLVFALWLLPWLWRTLRDAATPRTVRAFALATAGLLFVALWIHAAIYTGARLLAGWVPAAWLRQGFDHLLVVALVLQWALGFCLLVFLAHYLGRAADLLAGRPGPRGPG